MLTAPAPQRRRTGGPRHQVTIDRHLIVGQRMDYLARAHDALDAAGAAGQLIGRLNGDAITFEIHRALRDTRKALVALVSDLRRDVGCLDGLCDDPNHRHPGHGRGA
jgi:hypothetical protein